MIPETAEPLSRNELLAEAATARAEFFREAAAAELLTPTEAAQILKVGVGTLAGWRCSKKVDLHYILVGTAVRYRRRDVEAFLTAQSIDGKNGPPAGMPRRRGGPGRPPKNKKTVRRSR